MKIWIRQWHELKQFRNQENIMVFGDYDVDGTTAVSLVSSYLKSYYP
jgi:single-stranded-DNA-specific exonuclease